MINNEWVHGDHFFGPTFLDPGVFDQNILAHKFVWTYRIFGPTFFQKSAYFWSQHFLGSSIPQHTQFFGAPLFSEELKESSAEPS